MKNCKSPGIDNITSEAIKYGGLGLHNKILEICNDVFTKNVPPWQMTTNIIIPIFKKGDNSKLTNYRGISLMSAITKIYNKLILNRIYDKINDKLLSNQKGYRKLNNTTQLINVFRRIKEGFCKNNLTYIATFIDLSKAFDSIDRTKLWKILKNYGLSDKIISAIKCIYQNSKAKIQIKGQLSNELLLSTGVLQGDALAPFLFIIVIDYLLKNISDDYGLITHKNPNIKLKSQAYADDIVLLDNNPTLALQHLVSLEAEAHKVGLNLNLEKTKFTTNIQDDQQLIDLKKKVGQEEDYKYLGSYISSTIKDFTVRKGIALAIFNDMWKIWNSKVLPLNLKIRIYNATIVPIFLYGCETWILSKDLQKKINIFGMHCLRRILGIQRIHKVRNNKILERTSHKLLIYTTLKRQSQFIIKTKQLPPTDISNMYLFYSPAFGKPKRGRSSALYDKSVVNLLTDFPYDFSIT